MSISTISGRNTTATSSPCRPAVEQSASRLFLFPSGQRLGDRVQKGNATVAVGSNDRIANAGEGDTEPFILFAQRFRLTGLFRWSVVKRLCFLGHANLPL